MKNFTPIKEHKVSQRHYRTLVSMAETSSSFRWRLKY